jgi:quinate dehydrogenase (quinone)
MAFGSAPRGIPRILQWLLAGLMMLIGLAVGGLGFKLATVGGSSYFLIMGVAMVIAAILIFLNRTSGIVLYGIAFIASLFWAVSDAGWDFWPLFSRLFTFAVLAFLCAIVWPFLRAANHTAPNKAPLLASRRCSRWRCWSASAGCLSRRPSWQRTSPFR